MNKNFILILMAGAGVVVVAFLLFLQPNANSTFQTQRVEKQTSASTQSSPNIVYENQKREISQSFTSQSKKQVKKKKIDPSIKAATVDHYHRYLLQLIDDNPKDKELHLESKPDSYVYVEGKISGNQYVMRVPKAVANRPGIKLKITDLKTKKIKEVDASFLSEAATLPIGSTFKANIDLNDPNNIQTDIKLPEENPPFPTMR